MVDHDLNFNGNNDAMAEIRGAVRYLLKGVSEKSRNELVREIIEFVQQTANERPPARIDE